MRRLAFIISIFLFSLTFLLPTPTFADDTASPAMNNDLLKIYQERRSGNQMNLETWYGGKYGGTQEESIGFGDIILLDLMEKVGGSSNDNAEELQNLLQLLLNDDPQNLPEQSYQPSIQKITQKGAIQGTTKLITSLYQTPPASSTDYLAYVKDNLQDKKIVQPAYADSGYGFSSLQPLLKIWKIFRNIAYFVFVLGFILYGFMIMFRIKINPQTAITIQLALPKLIITLLLITFSYAVAGFMIDLFYLIWGIIVNVFISQGIKGIKFFSGYNWGLLAPFLGGILGGTKFIIADLWSLILPIPQALGAAAGIAMAFTPLAAVSIILGLILLIALLYTFIKIWWMLLKSYVNIVINIIFSPVILLGNILPGSKSFGNWLKNILAELSVFIATMVMFTLSAYFMFQFQWFNDNAALTSSGHLWVPPLLQPQSMTNWGIGPNTASSLSLLGLGILLMTPKIAEMIKNALQIKDLGYGSAISDSFNFMSNSGVGKAAKSIAGGAIFEAAKDPLDKKLGEIQTSSKEKYGDSKIREGILTGLRTSLENHNRSK